MTDLHASPFVGSPFLCAHGCARSGPEQDRLQAPAEGANGVAGQPARRLRAQGHRQPPEVPLPHRRTSYPLSHQAVPFSVARCLPTVFLFSSLGWSLLGPAETVDNVPRPV